MDAARIWIESSPYSEALGVELVELTEERATVRLPFRDVNANPGDALHGGVAASLAAMGGQLIARAVMGEEAGPFYTASAQISYLSAAIGEAVIAETVLLRRGKELCFSTVSVCTEAGKAIAHASSVVRAGFGETTAVGALAADGVEGSDPGRMGPLIEMLPFMQARGLRVEHMADGCARLAMPLTKSNCAGDGGVHEGAVLALIDTAGAMASWASVPPGHHKASTPALQAQFHAPPPGADVVAHARVVQRDRETFWSHIDCANANTGEVFAQASELYRIVVAEKNRS